MKKEGKELTGSAEKDLTHTLDFVLNIVKAISDGLEGFHKHFLLLPKENNVQNILTEIADCQRSMVAFSEADPLQVITENSQKEWYHQHSALIYMYADSFSLLKHSLASAFSGYYTVAYIELRSAMEGLIRGTIFDLLAYPEFRSASKILKKIQNIDSSSKDFSDLIEELNRRYASSIIPASAEIFDIIAEKFPNFNPRASLKLLLYQLAEWKIIDSSLEEDLYEHYKTLSKYVHRVIPKFSEPGIRVEANKDWIRKEPVAKELINYLKTCTSTIGLFLALILNIYNRDLKNPIYKDSINVNAFCDISYLSAVLKDKYRSWKIVYEAITSLLKYLAESGHCPNE